MPIDQARSDIRLFPDVIEEPHPRAGMREFKCVDANGNAWMRYEIVTDEYFGEDELYLLDAVSRYLERRRRAQASRRFRLVP